MDAEFKILVIRMLREMIEYSCKIKEEAKARQSEIKKNIQGTNSEGKETRTQINYFQQKEEINIQSNKARLRNHWDNFYTFQHLNHRGARRRRRRARN